MQRIERYGVIALVFLLVTIVAVSLWGERGEGEGWMSFLERDSGAARVSELVADARSEAELSTADRAARGLERRTIPLAERPDDEGAPHARRAPEAPWVGDRTGPLAPRGREDLLGTDEPLTATSILPPPQVPEVIPTPARLQPQEPAATAERSYTVRSGDTLSEISQRELGTQRRWREIVACNPGLDPLKLSTGQVLKLPAAGAPAAATEPGTAARATPSQAAAPAPVRSAPERAREYVVRAGDTLSEIAQRELGSARRWSELVALNPDLDPARLKVGTTLRLPAGGEAARTETPVRVARAEPRPERKPQAEPSASRRKVR